MHTLFCIMHRHRSIIADNDRYKLLIQSVKAGSLQNLCVMKNKFIAYKYKIETDSILAKIIHDTTRLCYKLRVFNRQYYHSISSLFMYTQPTTYLSQMNTCYAYRTIHNVSHDLDTLYHPIPFSSANNIEFAKDWMYYDGTDIILKIQFAITDPYIAICDDEHEIIFPPSVIHVHSKTTQYHNQSKYELWYCTITFHSD